jgi:coproporphyrinogen III oxidase-like Fe-S oxidoreductase
MAIADWLEGALRLVDGFAPQDFAARFGADLDELAGPPLAECEAAGIVERQSGLVRLTRRGHSLHSEVVVRVMAHLSRGRA